MANKIKIQNYDTAAQTGQMLNVNADIVSNEMVFDTGPFVKSADQTSYQLAVSDTGGVMTKTSGGSGVACQLYMTAENAATMNSSGRTFLGTSGANFLSFGGANPDDDESGWQFIVPCDYQSGGRFRVIFTMTNTANNVAFEMDVTVAEEGETMSTVTESLAAQATAGPGTDWLRVTTANYTPSTATFVVGDYVAVRLHRDASDALDTATNIAYVSNLIFEYNY